MREEVACFLQGMSKSSERKFGFGNFANGSYSSIDNVTDNVMTPEYYTIAAAAYTKIGIRVKAN